MSNTTLTSAEMPDFYAGGPYTVGRDYGGRVAHIYMMNALLCLCHSHYRIRGGLAGYMASDKNCKRCLVIYRHNVQEVNMYRCQEGVLR